MTQASAHIEIKSFQYEQFERTVLGIVAQQDSFSSESLLFLNETQKAFMNSFLLTDDGSSFRKDYRLWLRIYRDTLADELNFNEQGDAQAKTSLPKSTRMKLMEDAHEGAMKVIIVKQQELFGELFKLKASNPRQRQSNSQKLFLTLPKDLKNHIPLFISVIVGKCLGHYKGVRSDSFVYAGMSYNMKVFCETMFGEIISDVGTVIELGEEDSGDESMDDSTPDTIRGGSTKTNLLRVCVLNVWTKKLDVDEAPYSTEKLLGEWLKDGIELFNSNVQAWSVSSGDSMGPIPPELYQNVRKLACGWLRNMNGKFRNKANDPNDKMPAGTFNDSVLIANKRADWEHYFNCRILHAKVRLCGTKRDRPVGTSESAQKRRAIQSSIAVTNNSSVFLDRPKVDSDSNPQDSTSTQMSTRELLGSLGNLFRESAKSDEALLNKLIEVSNKNSDKVVKAILYGGLPHQRQSNSSGRSASQHNFRHSNQRSVLANNSTSSSSSFSSSSPLYDEVVTCPGDDDYCDEEDDFAFYSPPQR